MDINRYKAAFLIPSKATKSLEDYGWIFTSDMRVSDETLTALISILGLNKTEEFEGSATYCGDAMKVSVAKDENGRIEHFYFQLFGIAPELIKERIVSVLTDDLEFFVP